MRALAIIAIAAWLACEDKGNVGKESTVTATQAAAENARQNPTGIPEITPGNIGAPQPYDPNANKPASAPVSAPAH